MSTWDKIKKKVVEETVGIVDRQFDLSFFKRYEHYETLLLSKDSAKIKKMFSHPALSPKRKERRAPIMERIATTLLMYSLLEALPDALMTQIWESNTRSSRGKTLMTYLMSHGDEDLALNLSKLKTKSIFNEKSDESLHWIFKTISPDELVKQWMVYAPACSSHNKETEWKTLTWLDEWMATNLDEEPLRIFSEKFELLQSLWSEPVMLQSKTVANKKYLQSSLTAGVTPSPLKKRL